MEGINSIEKQNKQHNATLKQKEMPKEYEQVFHSTVQKLQRIVRVNIV